MEIYGANIAAGLSGQKFERSKVCIREYISLLCARGGERSVPESAHLSNTQHQGACSRGGVRGGVYPPPGTAAVSKHETGTVTKQTTGAVSTHETGTVTKHVDWDLGFHTLKLNSFVVLLGTCRCSFFADKNSANGP